MKSEGPQPANTILRIYETLHAAYGPQHWWPGDGAEEIAIGAILTQNTAWTNVEKAIARLKAEGCLSFRAIDALDADALSELIRSAGTYRQKAAYLKNVAHWLMTKHNGDLAAALSGELKATRRELLAIKGIGPETADAILLYAGGQPTFVVDAYTKRVLRRHHLIDPDDSGYERVRKLCTDALPADVQLFNEYHALFVEVGKRHCETNANCEGCPLESLPHIEEL